MSRPRHNDILLENVMPLCVFRRALTRGHYIMIEAELSMGCV